MSPRRVGALIKGVDSSSKTIWIVDAVDMDGETTIGRFIQKNSDCFGGLICFIDIEENGSQHESEFDDYLRIDRAIELEAQKAFRAMFQSDSKIVDLDMRIDGRKVRCCCVRC